MGEATATKRTDCPVCGSGATLVVWWLRGSRSRGFAPLRLCVACGSYFQRTGYREDDQQLRDDFDWHVGHRVRCSAEAEAVVEQLQRLSPSGSSLLDIGCGIGSLMVVASEKGLVCEGVEPNPYAARYAREVEGLSVVEGYFSATSHRAGYDFIVIDSVLEHVGEPRVVLADAVSLLNPGGLLYVSVPGRQGGHLRIVHSALFRSAASSLFADNDVHINHFGSRSVVRVVEQLGATLCAQRAEGQWIFRRA